MNKMLVEDILIVIWGTSMSLYKYYWLWYLGENGDYLVPYVYKSLLKLNSIPLPIPTVLIKLCLLFWVVGPLLECQSFLVNSSKIRLQLEIIHFRQKNILNPYGHSYGLCDRHVESVSHMFITCDVTKKTHGIVFLGGYRG